MKKITILIHCKDQSGIIAAVTSFVSSHNGNIVYIDQHVDREQEVFFMRLESEFYENTFDIDHFSLQFKQIIALSFEMKWELYPDSYRPKMALFVSRYDHCLYDILGRYKSGELQLDIPFIVSNHEDLEEVASSFGVPFFHVPVLKDHKEKAHQSHLGLLSKYKIDFIVLARYMQIIPEQIIEQYPNKIINIHHSFLPAFVGAKPYHSAYKRGVKIIGATSHYVTQELDAGPIIEQDVTRVSHTHSIQDLVSKGRDLEKIVLSTAIKQHLEHKVMVYNNKTVIFS